MVVNGLFPECAGKEVLKCNYLISYIFYILHFIMYIVYCVTHVYHIFLRNVSVTYSFL